MAKRSVADPLGLGNNVVDTEKIREALKDTDHLVGRVFEDTIKLLVDRGMIRLSDLPGVARETLEARQKLRAMLRGKEGKEGWG